jgi:mRNA-degrading endonuclease RelE of RelBE toxin-antitoxin system
VPQPRDLVLAPEIRELVRVLHPTTKRKVRAAMEAVRSTPEIGDELTREFSGLRRLRVGRLRIVYRVRGRQVQIVAIGPRATIYIDLSAQSRKGDRD